MRPPAALLAVPLTVLIAVTALPGGLIRSAAATAQATFTCEPVPASTPSPSATASPSASPASLCVSVTASQDSVEPGGTSDWSLAVWAQGVMPNPVTVTLTAEPASLGPYFTASCPAGNFGFSCMVGALGSGSDPSIYQMQAQIAVPASAAGPVTLVVTASVATSPLMPQYPQVSQSISVTSPSPTASPSASATSAGPSPSPSATSGSAPHTSGPSSGAGKAPGHAPGRDPGPAAGQPSPGQPPLGQPPLGQPPLGQPGGGLGAVLPGTVPTASDSGSLSPGDTIASMLPVLAQGTDVPPSSIPLANAQAVPGTSGAVADAGSFTLSIGMPASTARAVALVILALVTVVAVVVIGRSRRAAAVKAGDGSQSEVGITRWLWLMFRRRFRARR